MSKVKSFKAEYKITISGSSRKSDWNKYTFMEEMFDEVLNTVTKVYDLQYKGLKVKIERKQIK